MLNTKRNDKSRKNKLGFLDDHTLDYYRRVHETLTTDIEGEEKELFLNNVFSQLSTEAIKVSQNQTTSRFIEKLLVEARPVHATQLLTEFSKDWSTVSSDRFASHVLQNLITQSPKYVSEEEEGSPVKDLILEYCSYVNENIEMTLTDTYASHILRSLLEVLGGVDVSTDIIRSRISKHQNKNEQPRARKDNPPTEYTDCFKKLVKKIFSMCNYSEHFTDPNSSPVFQTILLIQRSHDPESCHKYVKKILRKSGMTSTPDSEEEDTAPQRELCSLVKNEVGSYLVEQIIVVSLEGNEQRKVYRSIFKGRLLNFAIDRIANYILQKFIDGITQKELFEEIFDELGTYVEDVLAMHHIGILSKLANGCIRLHTRQEKFIMILMEAFHCVSPEDRQVAVGPLLLSLSTYEVYYNTETETTADTTENTPPERPASGQLTNINYHGSVLMQTLLKFGQTKLVVASLLALKPVELKLLLCDSCGSHVIDAFCQSETVGDKKRDLLLQKMKGVLLDTACHRNGSRSLESVWKTCSVKQRVVIAQELAKQEDKLRSSQFGHFVHRNFDIAKFKSRRSEWTSEQGSTAKKRKLFKDFLEDSSTDTSPKKKSKFDQQPLQKSITKDKSGDDQSRSKKHGDKKVKKNGRTNEADDNSGDSSDEDVSALLGDESDEEEEEEASKLLDSLVKKHHLEAADGKRKNKKQTTCVDQDPDSKKVSSKKNKKQKLKNK